MMVAEIDIQMNLITMLKLLANIGQLLRMTKVSHPSSSHIVSGILLLLEIEGPPSVTVNDPRPSLDRLQSKRLLLRFVTDYPHSLAN